MQLCLSLGEREGGTGDSTSTPAWLCQPAFGWRDVLRASPVPGLQPRLCLLLPLGQAGSPPPWLGRGRALGKGAAASVLCRVKLGALPLFRHLLPHAERCCQNASGTAAGSQAPLLSGEPGRQRHCWEQSVQRGRAKAAGQMQTMCRQQAELLSCLDGQTEPLRLRRQITKPPQAKGKDVAWGKRCLSCLVPAGKAPAGCSGSRVYPDCPAWPNSAGSCNVWGTERRPGDGRRGAAGAQPAAGSATSTKSPLPVPQFPPSVAVTDPHRSQPEADPLHDAGSPHASSSQLARIKPGNPDAEEVAP